MDDQCIYAAMPDALLPWYDAGHRELPWRQDKRPYHIWISEIMLQQTRVEAVKGYYTRFLEAFPTVCALAEAEDEKLQKLWEGLGYYSRMRNLKKAAVQIRDVYGGVFPSRYEDVLALPGVGEYTAGAICSIAFDRKIPAVDGNVLRVTARLTDDDTPIDAPAYKKKVQAALQAVYPDRAGDFTQALMELGATVCGPNRAPQCAVCPCRAFCRSYAHGTAERLPVKKPKVSRREEDRTVFILRCEDSYCLEKRPNTGLLAGLWQFPNVPGKLDVQEALTRVEAMGLKPRQILKTVERKHIFTHITWNLRGVYILVQAPGGPYTWLPDSTIRARVALPTAFRQFFEEI